MFRFDTISVSINAVPEKIWEFVADINNWPLFSDFASNIEKVQDGEWIFHTSQGDVRVIEKFNRELLLLDTICIVSSGDEQFIPYRVVPNGEGSEIIMTNQQTDGVTDEEYAEQLTWMREELENIKRLWRYHETTSHILRPQQARDRAGIDRDGRQAAERLPGWVHPDCGKCEL